MGKFALCGARIAYGNSWSVAVFSQRFFMCRFIFNRKKLIASILTLCLFLSGCGAGKEGQEKASGHAGQESTSSVRTDRSASQAGAEAPQNETGTSQKQSENTAGKVGSLRLLNDRQMSFMTSEGYYYITGNSVELGKDLRGRHIMYMDFATKKEVYLCNEPGCKHKDKNCTSVLPEEEFGDDCILFVLNNRLWLVSKDQDDENTIASDLYFDEKEGLPERQKLPTVIYSMNRDGSSRKKEYTFEQDVTVDQVVLCDGENMYLAAKKVNAISEKQATWHTATERKLVRFRTRDSVMETVCSLQPDNKIRWYVAGGCGDRVILQGTKYNQNLSWQEEMALDKEEYWKYAKDSSEVYASLDPADGSIKKIYSIKNDPDSENSTAVLGNFLYVSREKEGTVQKVDLKTGKAKMLARLKQNFIEGTMSDKLRCQAWDQTKPHIYFVDINTGEISHCTLVNQCNGWELEIKGDTGSQVLLVYDYDAKEDKEEKGAWEISRYQYGLIDKKDLYKSIGNFQKIEMKEEGQ